MCWFAATVVAIVPALWLMITTVRSGRVGVDALALLSLVGTLAVGEYLAGAAAAHAVPVLVLYRIPERDCGGWSSGGADSEQEYKDWVKGVATALKGHRDAMVIIEPDALPQLGSCEQGDRLGMLKYAVDNLSTTGARVYIDIGNEDWLSPDEAARRLKEVGVDKIAGFSVNVAAHYNTGSEVLYAETVRSELAKLGK